jgi:hypothetical protein
VTQRDAWAPPLDVYAVAVERGDDVRARDGRGRGLSGGGGI